MSKRPPDPTVLHQVARGLKRALRKHRLTPTQAAEKLGIKRQTLWLYLNEKAMPGGTVLGKACELWNLSLTIKGFTFTKGAFPRAIKDHSREEQLRFLFDAVDEISPDQIQTKLISRPGGFELRVRIKAAS